MQRLTTPVHQRLAVETLQAEIRKVCGTFDVEPMTRSGTVEGSVAARRIGFFDTAIVGLDARHVQRTARSIRHDPGEYLFLLTQDQGSCRVEQGEHCSVLAPGDMFLVDSARPSSFVYDGQRSTQVAFHLPRDEMRHRIGQGCMNGVPISREDPLWLAMRAVITKLISEPEASSQLNEALLSLLGGYLHCKTKKETARPAETLLSRALAMIDRHCSDPNFSPSELARQLSVSERMLQRHFEPLGETPRHRLLNRRLELARTKLMALAQGKPNRGIATIAYDSGFNDLSYFYREFRKKYAVTPGAAAANVDGFVQRH